MKKTANSQLFFHSSERKLQKPKQQSYKIQIDENYRQLHFDT